MTLKDKIRWAITKFKGTQKDERQFGQNVMNKITNQWSTSLGESLVEEILQLAGKNPIRPKTKKRYRPDFETENFIYEVKTRSWCTSGTAGEKVLGTMYKYSDIPIIYKKPLKIICIGYQEYELTYGNTKIFDPISSRKQKFLMLAKEFDIEYVKFTDFLQQHYCKLPQHLQEYITSLNEYNIKNNN